MRWQLWVTVAGLLVVSTASAQTAEDIKLAKQYFQLGEALYNRSDYRGALEQFERAYKYARLPDLVYNMARCNELVGHHGKAITLYEEFMQVRKDPRGEAQIKARIATLRTKLAEDDAKRKAEAARREQQQQSLAKERQERARLEAALAQQREAAHRERQRAAAKGPLWPIVALAGSGGAFVIAGVVFGAMAKAKASSLEDDNTKGTDWSAVAGDFDSGQKLQTLQILGLALGGTALTGAAVWLLVRQLRGGKQDQRTAILQPALLPGGAYLGASLRF